MMTNAVVKLNEYKMVKQYEEMNGRSVAHTTCEMNKKKLDPKEIERSMIKGYIKLLSK